MTEPYDPDRRAAEDPATDAAALAVILTRRPDLAATIARHPNAYDELLDWIAAYGGDLARARVAARRGAMPPAQATRPRSTLKAPASTRFSAVQQDWEPKDEQPVPAAKPDQVGEPGSRFAVLSSKLGRRGWFTLLGGVAALVVVVLVVTIVVGVSRAHQGVPARAVSASSRTSRPKARPTPAATATASPTPTSTPTPTTPVVPAVTWSFSTPSGYGYTMQMSMGAPVTSGTNGTTETKDGNGIEESSSNTIGSACTDFNRSRDVAIPVTLTVTATTKGFKTPLAANVMIETLQQSLLGSNPPSDLQTISLESEEYYTGGDQCTDWPLSDGSTVGVSWPTTVAKGGSDDWNFTVIIKNYRSPNAPSGDTSLLDWIAVVPLSSTSSSTGVGTFTQQSGPAGITLSGKTVSNQ